MAIDGKCVTRYVYIDTLSDLALFLFLKKQTNKNTSASATTPFVSLSHEDVDIHPPLFHIFQVVVVSSLSKLPLVYERDIFILLKPLIIYIINTINFTCYLFFGFQPWSRNRN